MILISKQRASTSGFYKKLLQARPASTKMASFYKHGLLCFIAKKRLSPGLYNVEHRVFIECSKWSTIVCPNVISLILNSIRLQLERLPGELSEFDNLTELGEGEPKSLKNPVQLRTLDRNWGPILGEILELLSFLNSISPSLIRSPIIDEEAN